MRILRVAQKCYPDVKGGGAYHVHAMSRDQAAMGHDVTVLTIGNGPVEERDGYTVVRFPSRLSMLGNDIAPGVWRYLRTERFDVVHAHSHLYFSTNLAAFNRWLTETPLAITNHGLYSQSASERLFGAYLRTVGRWTFDRADVVFTYTDAEKTALRDLGVDAPIAVVANGIDTDRFTPEGPTSDQIDRQAPAILFVGRLTDGKRPADAIEALVGVREVHPNVRLYLAGDGDRRDALEALAAERGVADAVTFLGHVSYDEMPALYRGADVLVLPSRAEGMPRTVMEALATGTPVVTSDLPQLRSLTDEAGRAVPVGDTTALAAQIADILKDLDQAEVLGERGRKLVTQRHTWAETVRQTTARLERLVDE